MAELITMALFCGALIVCIIAGISIIPALLAGVVIFLAHGRLTGHTFTAMISKGFATMRAASIVVVTFVLIGLLTTLFSLAISHVGATIFMVPIAINVALAAGGNPTAVALIVALSASNNLMTASNPVMSMVTGPANYTGRDLWRVGGPLSLVYLVIIVIVINLLY